jgi:uncharacterized protein DUF4440
LDGLCYVVLDAIVPEYFSSSPPANGGCAIKLFSRLRVSFQREASMRFSGRFSVAALFVAFVSCAAIPRQVSVRRQLDREYATIAAGFRRDDPSEWIRRLSPDFHLTLFNGAIQDRDWVVKYVRNNAKTFHVVELTMSIKDLTIAGNQAVATVEQKSSRTFADGSGQHRLDVGAVQLETWQRSPDGWKLKAVREKELLYVRKDGKPPKS